METRSIRSSVLSDTSFPRLRYLASAPIDPFAVALLPAMQSRILSIAPSGRRYCQKPLAHASALRLVRWDRFSPSKRSRSCVAAEGSCATRTPLRASGRSPSRCDFSWPFFVRGYECVLPAMPSAHASPLLSKALCTQHVHDFSLYPVPGQRTCEQSRWDNEKQAVYAKHH